MGELDNEHAEKKRCQGFPEAQHACSGDDEAFVEILRLHEERIVSHMRRFTHDWADVEDLVQDVIVEVYLSLPMFNHRGSFSNWLHRIASRVGYRYWNRRTKEQQAKEAFAEISDHALGPTATDHSQFDMETLTRLLNRLDPIDRTILNLRYFQDLSNMEIARRMGWDPVRVRVRAHRARAKLQEILEQEGCGR
jgi:RNA polymerase sigma-70 factor, ECF subfamily